MKREIEIEVFYPHPPEKVWTAIADRRALGEWLMETDFEPVVGHHFTFRMPPKPGFDGVIRCEVLEVERPRRLAYSWSAAWGSENTVVTWTLTAEEGGTRLRLEHGGFRGIKGFFMRRMMGAGWRKKLRTEVRQLLQAGEVPAEEKRGTADE